MEDCGVLSASVRTWPVRIIIRAQNRLNMHADAHRTDVGKSQCTPPCLDPAKETNTFYGTCVSELGPVGTSRHVA